MDKIGLVYAPLCSLSDTPWGWLKRTNNRWTLRPQVRGELRAVANVGTNMVRLLALAPWLENGVTDLKRVFAPFAIGPSGCFSLRQFDNDYFSILKDIVQIANEHALVVWLDLFDHCGCGDTNSPWVTNEEGVSDYASPRADQYTRAYIKTLVETLRGRDVIFGWGNEFRDRDETEFCFRVVAPTLAECGVLWGRQAYGADNTYHEPCEQDWQKSRLEDAFGVEAKLSVVRPVHGIGVDFSRAELIASWWGRNPIRKCLSDDGVFNGDSAQDYQTDNPSRRRPSSEQWGETIRALGERQPPPTLDAPALTGLWLWAFEHSPKQWQTLETFLTTQTATLSAMADEIEIWQGAPLANRGKFPPVVDPVSPPPEPTPNPEPGPTGPVRHCWKCSWWRRLLCWFRLRPRRCR